MSAIRDIAIGVPDGRRGYSAALTVLALLLLGAAAYFAYLLSAAPASVPWGFVAASFVFVLGISQFGIAFAAILRICRARWARPFYRIGEVATLAFLPLGIGLFLIIFIFGRDELFHWLSPAPGEHLSPWLNADFLLYRNLVAQLVFYIFSIVYFVTGLTPDVTLESAESGPGWRRGLYRWLWSRRQRKDLGQLKSNMYLYSPVLLVLAVIANTFIAWDFGMMLFPHYHSTVYPMYFILGNMLAGTATVLILGALTSRVLDLQSFFGTVQLKSVGIMLTGFVLLWLYMFWAQFFVTWYGNLPYETGPLWAQMFGHYGPYFRAMVFCVFLLPLGAMIFAPVKRNWWSLLLICAIIVVGVWLNRYLQVVPALMTDHRPFSSAVEVLLLAGLLAGFLLPFLLLYKVFPMISGWEMRDAAGEEGPAY